MKNFIIAALVLILLGIGGYYYYSNYYLQDDSNDDPTTVISADDSPAAYATEATGTAESAAVQEYETSDFDLESVLENVFSSGGSYVLDGLRNSLKTDNNNIIKYFIKENSQDNEKFIDLIDETKSKFYRIVSGRTYRISNVDKILSGLLLSYEDLYEKQENSNKCLKSIYKLMNNDNRDAEYYYDDIEKYISPESLEIYENIRNSNGSQFTNGDLVWYYSFWARRNNEGNAEQTVAIIRDVIEHYEPDIRKNSEE